MGVWEVAGDGEKWADKAHTMAMQVRAAVTHDGNHHAPSSPLERTPSKEHLAVEAEKARTARALADARYEQEATKRDVSLEATLAIAETQRKRADSLQTAMASSTSSRAAPASGSGFHLKPCPASSL